MFKIQQHTEVDKSFVVRDRVLDIEFIFDYDDVIHDRVDYAARQVAAILNENQQYLKKVMKEFNVKQRFNEKV